MNIPAKGQEERLSGVELLKITAILLIVLNHCIQSLTQVYPGLPSNDYVLDINSITTNPLNLLLAILRSAGCIGNDIFVACSAWFMVGRKKNDKRKVSFLIINTFTVSVLIFAITYILGCDLDRDATLLQFFPTSNGNNWFVTCYVLLLFLYPVLNRIIETMSQRALLGTTLLLTFLYSVVNYFRPWFFVGNPFYSMDLIVWITIYFLVAYMKLYLKDFSKNIRANIIMCIIGLLGQGLMITGLNLAGLKIDLLQGKLMYFNYGGSPFIIMLAMGSLNIALSLKFRSRFINYISGLSLLIYIIHENFIIRNVYRPWIFYFIHERFGYDYILLWLLAVTAAIFIAAVLLAALYNISLERLVRRFSDRLYLWGSKLYHKLADALLKLH
ncbi:MAG: acyltransferase family protein [Lachnospiraceae bacterium]|jgi:hypothetical protein